MSLQQVISDVEDERAHQEDQWGVVNDDRNTLADWVIYIQKFSLKASREEPNSPTQRRRLIQVAALAVAAAESFDRNLGFPTPSNEYGLGCS